MNKIVHHDIDSKFFEYRKMKTFLEIGVNVYMHKVPHPPINLPQQYVHSQLFIDLISVFDFSIRYFIKLNNLKEGKHPLQTLINEGLIVSPDHFKWYKRLRNESAHEFIRHEWHMLNQATEHIANQFENWDIFSATLNFRRFYIESEDGKTQVGTKVDNEKILVYEAFALPVANGTSSSAKELVNLSLLDFCKIDAQWTKRIPMSRAS